MGLGIGSCLLKSGVRVDIIARPGTVAALQRDGLVRKGIFGVHLAEPSQFGAYGSLEELGREQYDHILVCTKSFDSLEAAKDLCEHRLLLREQTGIILFQNGWGNAETFCRFFDSRRIYSARVITGFRRGPENTVTVTVHADPIHIGSLFGGDLSKVTAVCELTAQGDIPCEVTDSIEKDLWAKMLYNCALNSLGAVLDVAYGVLAEHEYTRTIMNGIIAETFAVMKRAGYETHWPDYNDFLKVFYEKLVPLTADHKSSTLQDILAGKKTEIDALNGQVIELGRKHSLSVPYNVVVYNIVKFIEERKA